MACNLITEYLYDRFFVFGKSIDTNKRAHRIEQKEAEAAAAAAAGEADPAPDQHAVTGT